MALVIKAWRANAIEPDQVGNFVTIECRQEGIIGFVLNVLGIAPTTTIHVGSERVEFTSASLSGYSRRMIPLQGVCSTYYGFSRPLSETASIIALSLFVGVPLAINASALAGVIVCLLGIGLALIYYSLNKKLTLGFVENSGVVSGIQVKRSVIEGKKIEEEDARQVCQIIQNVIESRNV